jgi:hypothetical protein
MSPLDTLVADFTEKATFKGDSLSGTGSGQGLIDGNDGFLRFYQLSATLDITIQDQPTRITMTIKLARRKEK